MNARNSQRLPIELTCTASLSKEVMLDKSPQRPPGFDDLTSRELDVWKLVARGVSNKEIVNELFVGENTVKTHVGHLFTKLALRDRAQAVVVAYECQLVRAGRPNRAG